jgi:hypothetical protein
MRILELIVDPRKSAEACKIGPRTEQQSGEEDREITAAKTDASSAPKATIANQKSVSPGYIRPGVNRHGSHDLSVRSFGMFGGVSM